MFKKIFLLLSIFVTFSFANVDFVYDIETAKTKAQSENKQILVMFSMENCPACEYMKDVVFDNKDVSGYLNAYFVVYEVDYNKKETFPQGLTPFGTPTFYVLKSDGEKIGRALVGGMTANVFLEKIKQYR